MTSPDGLRDARLSALLEAVLGSVQGDDPRVGELIGSLVRHLHAFVRETPPTPEEWLAGLDFLVRTGHACTEHRNEFILLSDMLGLTTAVDDADFAGDAQATPSLVEGPFHSPAPARANGDWVSAGPERDRAEVMVVRGRVTDPLGLPVPGATVDIWQADDAGHYDTQDLQQHLGNLRGLRCCDWARPPTPSRSCRPRPGGRYRCGWSTSPRCPACGRATAPTWCSSARTSTWPGAGTCCPTPGISWTGSWEEPVDPPAALRSWRRPHRIERDLLPLR